MITPDKASTSRRYYQYGRLGLPQSVMVEIVSKEASDGDLFRANTLYSEAVYAYYMGREEAQKGID